MKRIIISSCMFLFMLSATQVVAQEKVKVKDDKTKIKTDTSIVKTKDDKTKVKSDTYTQKTKDDKTKVKAVDDKTKVKVDDDKTKIKTDDDKTKIKTDDDKTKIKIDDDKTKIKTDDDKTKIKTDDDKTKIKTDDDKTKIKTDDDKTKIKTDDDKTKIKTDNNQVIVTTPGGMNTNPYTASYSSNFVMGNSAHSAMILDMWKDWDDNAFDRHNYWADTVSVFLPDGTVIKGRDSTIAGSKRYRGSLASSKSTITSIVPLRSADRNEDWVAIWGTETDTWLNGKVENLQIHEIWRINKDGKIDLMRQYTAKASPQQ